MAVGSEAQIRAAVDAVIAGRDAANVLNSLYHAGPANDEALRGLVELLPIEQIALVRLVDKLNLSGLPAVVVLLAVLRNLRTDDEWIHYNLAKHLNTLEAAGNRQAKLPAVIHSLLAREGLKDRTDGQSLPLGILTDTLATFAPREAIRSAMLAARSGDEMPLRRAAPALSALGLKTLNGQPSIASMLQLADELHLSAENIPAVANSTDLEKASGLRSTVVEEPQRVRFPEVHGDTEYYLFTTANREVDVPGISVHTLEDGTFSIDATMRGLERHYVLDRNGDCILGLANGSSPFIAETVMELDEPVAILDDRFSGVLNICHFLLDRVTRIPLYDRAWPKPGKFFLVDDFPYHREIFARLGLAERLVIPTEKRVSLRAPELLFSSNIAADFRHPAHFCADWAVQYLRGALKIAERQSRPGRKLMISRGDTVGRRILNWDEIRPVFVRHGFEVIELGGLSLDAQIELFRDASQIVGVHGAGLTNILFAPRDCAVLEILPPLVAVHDYWLLASALGQHYSALIGEDTEFPRPDYPTWQHNDAYNLRDLVLPVERLEAALAALDTVTVATSAKASLSHSAEMSTNLPAEANVVGTILHVAPRAFRSLPEGHTFVADTSNRQPDIQGSGIDLILCHCSGYTLANVEPFFSSFLRLNGSVELCVFTSDMDDKFYQFCRAHGIRMEPAADHFDRKYHIQSARFFEYNSFLSNSEIRYRKIMITDVRDVLFQFNPFEIPFSHQVCFAAEDRIIGDDACNADWIKNIYGEKVLSEIACEQITCSGTTLGAASAMQVYVTMMCQELSWRQYDYLSACDQGFHNYIAWKIRPEFVRVDLEDHLFNTIGVTDPKRIAIADNLILVDGIAPPVIHQWDRHKKLTEFVRSSPRFRIELTTQAPPQTETVGGLNAQQPVDGTSEASAPTFSIASPDFWDVYRSFHAAVAAGDDETAAVHLDRAASFPSNEALPALTDRARLRFLGGEFSACFADVERALDAIQGNPMARWFKKDLAFMGALCRYAMQEADADDLLRLIPEDDPIFDEKRLQGPTMALLESGAQPNSDLLIERYLALRHRLHRNSISWAHLLESLGHNDFVLQIGAMDGVEWDPIRAAVTRLNSPGFLVEPVAELFEDLRRNYARNTRLTFANIAIGESSGFQTIYRVPKDKIGSEAWLRGASTLCKPSAESAIAPMVIPEPVRVLTFSDFCQEFKVTHFALLQIDTEGYDWKVLRQIDLGRFGTRIARLEYSRLPLEDRISAMEHLEAAGLSGSCDDTDFWAAKV